MNPRLKTFLPVALLAVLALVLVAWLYRFVEVDHCLDDGERWNREHAVCELTQLR